MSSRTTLLVKGVALTYLGMGFTYLCAHEREDYITCYGVPYGKHGKYPLSHSIYRIAMWPLFIRIDDVKRAEKLKNKT